MKTLVAALVFGLLVSCGGGSEAPQSTDASKAAPSKAPDENAALDTLKKINDAQSAHFKRTRRYALDYDELIAARVMNREPDSTNTGYDFRMRPTADAQTYTVSAVPVSSAASARHFFTDQSGAIHAEQGKDATAASPTVP